MIGSEKTCHAKKKYCHFIYDSYKTAYVLYIALDFILIEHSEVKLRPFLKVRYTEENLRKLRLEIKFPFAEKYSVFLRKSLLCNYVIISLQCVAYTRR